MSCSVCVIKFNKSTCSEVKCICDYSACKTCVRTYLLSTIQDPHCMNCRSKWSYDFVKSSLGASFVNHEWKEHKYKIMLDETISKREERMQHALNYRADIEGKEKIALLREKIKELQKEAEKVYDEIEDIENEKRVRHGEEPYYRNYLRRGANNNGIQRVEGGGQIAQTVFEETKKKKFVMPCQKSNCNGMLDEKYNCVVCNTNTCSKCFEEKNENHVCDEEKVETIKFVKQNTRPCPKCGVRISKISGCDQMWCVECKTAFSWNTGNIENKHIHNPHYYEYMRKNGTLAREPGDLGGGGQAICRDIRYTAYRRIVGSASRNPLKKEIGNYFQYINHIQEVTVADHERHIQQKNEKSLINEYLFILGKIDKEKLGDSLQSKHNHNLKDEAFLDIYRAIGLVGDDICQEIMNYTKIGDDEINKIFEKINHWSKYFNMELLKVLMLYDSKRTIEIFENFKIVEKKYESKTIMKSELERLKIEK